MNERICDFDINVSFLHVARSDKRGIKTGFIDDNDYAVQNNLSRVGYSNSALT